VSVDEHGTLVGYAAVQIMNSGKVAYLAQGFVMPEYQKLGMERFFMSYLNRVVPTSVEAFTLLVRDPHNQGAIDAHTRVGFRKIDRDLSARYAASLKYPARWYSTMVCLRSGIADVDGYIARLLEAAV
jgi:hypothetical protein